MKRIILLLILAAVPHEARAQAPIHFTANHAIHFAAGTDQDRRAWSAIPSARDIVAEQFEIAREDLNDDGSKEVILMAASSGGCGSEGCSVVVLENRAGRATAILDMILHAPLAVASEKVGQYRALAAVDDKGVILSGDQRGTPMFGKQMVYAMKVSETAQAAPPPAPRTNAQTSSMCVGRPNCAEVPTFVAIVSDFRLSSDGGGRVITATVRFMNKMNRALVVGYVQGSGLAVDDQGNRYGLSGSNAVRGIGEIVGDRLDPKFSLSPGERSDARFEFTFRPGREILGTKYEIDFTFREIDPVSGNQWRLGKEYALHFRGFTDAGVVPTAPAEPARSATATPSIAAAPVAAAVPVGAPAAAPAPSAALTPDPCIGTPRCYNAGPFIANITQVTVTGGSVEPWVKVTMRIRNVSNRALILGYRAESGQLTDDAGNRYTNEGHNGTKHVSGIGFVSDREAETSFVLAPGEARDASFDNWILRPRTLGTVFNYDLTLEELEVLPSKQVRSAHTYVVGFHDFRAGASPAATSAPGDTPVPDPCVGTPRCYNAGAFIAYITQVAVTGNNLEPWVKVTMKIRNVSSRRLTLAYRAESGQLTDDAGNRYTNEGHNGDRHVSGIGFVNGREADTHFVLAPREARDASFDNWVLRPRKMGSVFNYDLTLEEIEVLPSQQVRSAQTFAVGFHDFKRTTGESVLDAMKKAIKKP
jgi:hypothetical protein